MGRRDVVILVELSRMVIDVYWEKGKRRQLVLKVTQES